MKILLQHTRTLQYLRTEEAWTRSEAEARNFQHSQKAIDFAHQHNLTEVYIAVKFPGGDADVVAPLPALRPTATSAMPNFAAHV
jgi:hypothetical protein